ncbi:MAG: family 10 glycosylhydrolase [Chitinophagales bacterium]|nr:family 10 glycosylhydrolase [Chitinophagales bacterium]
MMKKVLLTSIGSLVVILLMAQPKFEFRGVWIATVENIDWPSKKTLSSDEQKAEFIRILDMHKRNGMNAIVMQIRPVADAFYPSQLEPWSEYLTGQQGKPPAPYYDPLEFMISETHKRGMEFHAWLNPYRAVFSITKSSVAPNHITRIHPEWFLDYGGKRYFDPGNKDAQKFVERVVQDIVRRYDVDAIHFDDYFYPYRVPGVEFPDSRSFQKYGKGMTRDDWRRSNVDSIIVMLNTIIKKEKPFVQFGISPFGVWRNIDKDPEGSNTKAGQTNYDDLYADILLWLKKGWIDYVVPQLYWEHGHKLVGFEVLTDWWAKHGYGRNMYIGQGIYRSKEPKSVAWHNRKELPNQINRLRSYSQIQGSVYFSSKTFASNPNGWSDTLRNHYYKYPAIAPPMPWIDNHKPAAPELIIASAQPVGSDNTVALYLRQDTANDLINRYVVYNFRDVNDQDISDPKNIHEIVVYGNDFYTLDLNKIPSGQKKVVIAVTSLTRTNNESLKSNYLVFEKSGNRWRQVTTD